jgi:hypothetical protein
VRRTRGPADNAGTSGRDDGPEKPASLVPPSGTVKCPAQRTPGPATGAAITGEPWGSEVGWLAKASPGRAPRSQPASAEQSPDAVLVASVGADESRFTCRVVPSGRGSRVATGPSEWNADPVPARFAVCERRPLLRVVRWHTGDWPLVGSAWSVSRFGRCQKPFGSAWSVRSDR